MTSACTFLQVTNESKSTGLALPYIAGQAFPSDKMFLSKVPTIYGGSYSQGSDSKMINAALTQLHA